MLPLHSGQTQYRPCFPLFWRNPWRQIGQSNGELQNGFRYDEAVLSETQEARSAKTEHTSAASCYKRIPMNLVDTHCHLFMEPLAADVSGVLDRAESAGVTRTVVPAYDKRSWENIQNLLSVHGRAGVHGAFGLHPWVADEALDLSRLEAFLRESGAVGVGEVGLDFAVNRVDHAQQREVLRAQLGLARDLNLPVILHCRKAFEPLAEELSPFSPRLRGVLHAFSRGPELAERFVSLGLHVAFAGTITRPGAQRARRSVVVVPDDRLLLETDAPSIGLEGVARANVEPRHIAEIASVVAELRGQPVDIVAQRTTKNAEELFGFH